MLLVYPDAAHPAGANHKPGRNELLYSRNRFRGIHYRVHLVVKVTKPVPGYQGITPAPKPTNGEINLSNANVLPRD